MLPDRDLGWMQDEPNRFALRTAFHTGMATGGFHLAAPTGGKA
jgi:hypothetical protein